MHIKNIVNKFICIVFIPFFNNTDKNTNWILKEAIDLWEVN